MSLAQILAAADYAARMHRDQRRKGEGQVPYINHVLDVARRVAQGQHGDDPVLVLGALLHDIVEDTEGDEAQIKVLFGADVAALVMEVTDDKALPKDERKRLQVVQTPGKSDRAKRLKLADLASNVSSITEMPPEWSEARKAEYLDWALAVAAGCRGVDDVLEDQLDQAVAQARLRLEGGA